MTKRYNGEVTYFNFKKRFGFIRCRDFSYSLFFYGPHASKNYRLSIKKGDLVTFRAGKNNRFPDQKLALSLEYIGYNTPTLEKLKKMGVIIDKSSIFLGKVKSWNIQGGIIISPAPELANRAVYLYYTRLIAQSVKPGDILAFQAVITTGKKHEYFAKYAIPVAEEDIELVLNELLHDNTGFYNINRNYFEQNTPMLCRYMEIISVNSYHTLVKHIDKFKTDYGNLPDEVIGRIDSSYQIQLWNNKYTDRIDKSLLSEFFKKAPINTKLSILSRLEENSSDNRINIQDFLRGFLDWFVSNKQYLKITFELKPILRLLKDWDESGNLYHEYLHEKLMIELDAKTITNLWLDGYLDRTDNLITGLEFLLQDKSVKKISKFIQRTEETAGAGKVSFVFLELLSKLKISDDHLLLLMVSEAFFCINEMSNTKKDYQSEYIFNYSPIILSLKTEIQLILKCYGVKVEKNFADLINLVDKNINILYLIIGLIRKEGTINMELIKKVLLNNQSLEERLQNDILSYPWNEIYSPLFFWDKENRNLEEIKHYFDYNLIEYLYTNLEPKYSLHHLKLLVFCRELQNLLKNDDYYGYRQVFKELEYHEKRMFVDLLNQQQDQLFESRAREEVRVCYDYSEKSHGIKKYTARLHNLFFKLGSVELKIGDNQYTKPFTFFKSRAVYNTIHSDSEFGKWPLHLYVNQDIIDSIEGLDELISNIELNSIKIVLGKTKLVGNLLTPETDAYAIDQQLKLNIHKYLLSRQEKSFEIHEFREPYETSRSKFNTRKIESDFMLSTLYTIFDSNNLCIFIWEVKYNKVDYATYMFASYVDNANTQYDKIVKAVSELKNLRTFLAKIHEKTEDKEIQRKCRSFLGYYNSIKKTRGDIDAFEKWKNKFEALISYCDPSDYDHDICNYTEFTNFVQSTNINITIALPRKLVEKKVKKIEVELNPESIDNPDFSHGFIMKISNFLQEIETGFLKNFKFVENEG